MRLKAKERIMKDKEAESDLKEKQKKEKIFTNTAKGRYRATESIPSSSTRRTVSASRMHQRVFLISP